MATWLIISVSFAVFFAAQAAFSFWRRGASQRAALVKERLAIGRAVSETEAELLRKDKRSAVGFIDDLLKDLGSHQRLQDMIDQAGMSWTPGTLVLLMTACGLVPALLVGALTLNPVAVFIFALPGLVPMVMVLSRRRKRMRKIDKQLPVALEMMTLSLRAGHSLAQTIELSASEVQAPLGEELLRCAEEHALGRGLDDVLVNMSRRLPSCRALRTFVVAVLVLQQTGGNLVEVIERIIETLRMQSQYERKLAAMTAEGKSSARMLSGLPVAFILLAYAADPGYIGLLFTDSAGRWMLAVAVLLWAVGGLWTRKLITPSSGG